jgi:probable phosphoglycerate mutase
MDEAQILAIDAQGDVANCSITEYSAVEDGEANKMALVRYNWTKPLERAGAAVTKEPDHNVLPP